MNKFRDLLAIGKRRKQGFVTFCRGENVDTVGDNQTFERVVFRYYQFDSDSANTLMSGPTFATGRVPKVEPRNRSHECLPGPSEPDDLQPGFQDKPGSDFAKLSSLPGHKSQQFSTERRNNIHVISITNSSCFHIGPQKTVNINNHSKVMDCAWPSTAQISQESEFSLATLLDCEERLSEDHIAVISLHFSGNWKEFGRNLGLEETFLEEQEVRNGDDGMVVVHDMLHEYLSRFPSTSFGFVIYVLSEIDDAEAVERLGQKVRSRLLE